MATGDGDKRKVTTDALETLGTIIDDKQKRDAIHLAVEPVVAGERLDPGDHVSIKNGIAYSVQNRADALGIVDPFLAERVRKGQRFWFVMYPRMVHSLRHVWTHPAFADEVAETSPVGDELRRAAQEIAEERKSVPGLITKEQAEKWLRNFAANADVPSFEEMMDAISNDSGYASFSDNASGEIPPEFWPYAEAYLGCELKNRAEWFSCSC